MRTRPFVFLLAALLLDCASLDPIPSGTCGNGVVDANEDCDSFPSQCGAPTSGTTACRLRCGDGLPPCPDGWGCSVQQFCRQPTGQFAGAGAPLSTGVSTMLVGDFDADGRADILGSGPRAADYSAKIRAHFFDDSANLAAVQPFLAPFASPVVRDFDGDGRADFAFGAGGLGIMLGQADRTFSPVVFPSFKQQARIIPILVGAGTLEPPGGAPSTYLFAGAVPNSSGQLVNVLAASNTGGANGDYALALPAGPQAILGTAWGARVLDGLADSTCGEVVLAFDVPPITKVLVYSPCARRAAPGPNGEPKARWAPEHKVIELSIQGKAEKGILLSDEDHDGHVDIVAGTSSAIFVAHGTGTDFTAFAPDADFEDMPLASGDLNADGVDDYVMPRSIRMSRRIGGGGDAGVGAVVYGYLQIGRPTRWTRAVIDRLNADAVPDIIASADSQPDIDFLAGTGGGGFTPSTISTTAPVTQLATGDIDGDQVTDVIFAQQSAVSGENAIGIAYGRVVGPPEPMRSVGKFATITRMDALERAGTARRDLAIFAETPGATAADVPTVSFAILLGSGDRQPIAPLLLTDDLAKAHSKEDPLVVRDWRVQNVIAGPLETPSRVDVAMVALGYRFRAANFQPLPPPYPAGLWASKGVGPTDFESPREVLSLDFLASRLAKSEAFIMHAVSGDVDTPPNGVDEIVAFSENAEVGGPAIVVVRSELERPPMIKVDTGSVHSTNQLDLLDVDGDGARDVVLLAGAPAHGKLLVFLNDRKGGFAQTPLEVKVGAQEAGGGDAPITGFAQITTGAAFGSAHVPRKRELVVVTAHRVFLALLTPDRSRFDVRSLTAFESLAEGTGAAVGDFDGDGIEDVAVADKGSIRIARQIPRLP
jgi:hypothetical protein